MEFDHEDFNESSLNREVRGLIATAVDENIDKLEQTLIEKTKPEKYQKVYTQIDAYARTISTFLDDKITSILNKHLEKADESIILSNIDIAPIINQIQTLMSATKEKKQTHQPNNISLNKKINDLLWDDLQQTKVLFGELKGLLDTTEL